MDYRKRGTLIPTSLLEDLVCLWPGWRSVWGGLAQPGLRRHPSTDPRKNDVGRVALPGEAAWFSLPGSGLLKSETGVWGIGPGKQQQWVIEKKGG